MLETNRMAQQNPAVYQQLAARVARCVAAAIVALLCSVATANAENRDEIILFVNDALGTAIAAYSESGKVCWSETYTPYGDKTVNDDVVNEVGCGIVGEERGFTGHTEDVNSDLVYMQQRYYDPSIGRFLSIDPLGANPSDPKGYNRYAYAFNNPLRYVDPDGRYGSDWNAETFDQYNNTDASRDIENGLRDGSGSFSGGNTEGDSVQANIGYWTHGLHSNEDVQLLLEVSLRLGFLNRLKNVFAVTNKVGPKVGSAGGPYAGLNFIEKLKDAVRRESNNTCVFCGVETIRTKRPHPQRSHIDHAIPKSRNGNNTLDNAQNTCQTCNLDKGTRTTLEYLEYLNR